MTLLRTRAPADAGREAETAAGGAVDARLLKETAT